MCTRSKNLRQGVRRHRQSLRTVLRRSAPRFSRDQKDGRTQICAWVTFREGGDIKTGKALTWVAAIATIAVLGIQNVDAIEKEGARTPVSIPAIIVADLLHAVITAHREFYTIHIVNRLLQEEAIDVS